MSQSNAGTPRSLVSGGCRHVSVISGVELDVLLRPSTMGETRVITPTVRKNAQLPKAPHT